jgi:hypothetical protein
MVDLIGAGRVGGALFARAEAAGVPARLISRREGWEALDAPAGGPILVLTRNDDLESVVARTPRHRWADLVFLQNGMLRPWLAARGLGGATRGILFVAVPERGAPLVAGGETPLWGPHADAVAAWLRAIEVPSAAVSAAAFADVELEKLLWAVIFGVIGQVTGDGVGVIAERRRADVAELVRELAPLARGVVGAEIADEALVERLCAYSASIPAWRAGLREWSWRNGWFVEAAAEAGVRTPAHARWLALAGR